MTARMSNREFITWQLIYYLIDPFGSFGEDLRMGRLAAPILNLMEVHTYKTPRTHQPSEFILNLAKPASKSKRPEGMDWRDMQAIAKGLAGVYKKKQEGKQTTTNAISGQDRRGVK